MKVLIDGQPYVPAMPQPSDKTVLAVLEVRFNSDAGDNLTVREYLYRLLTTLWHEQEGFSGKRPFGNGDWAYQLYKPLIRGGFITGKLDEDGYIESVVEPAAKMYVQSLIDAVFFGVRE